MSWTRETRLEQTMYPCGVANRVAVYGRVCAVPSRDDTISSRRLERGDS
jgi:hypothetical protein